MIKGLYGVNGNLVPQGCLRRFFKGKRRHRGAYSNSTAKHVAVGALTLRHVGPVLSHLCRLAATSRLSRLGPQRQLRPRSTSTPKHLPTSPLCLWPILSVPDYNPLLARFSPIASSFIALLPASRFLRPSSMPSKIRATFTP